MEYRKEKAPVRGCGNHLTAKGGKAKKAHPNRMCEYTDKGCAYAQAPKAVQETSDENKLLILAFVLRYLFVTLSASFLFYFLFVATTTVLL